MGVGRRLPLIAVLAVAVLPASASGASTQGATLCTWGGTPAAPTGVFTASPGVTMAPSAVPINFTATGELGGGAGCNGRLTFRGVIDPGMTCMANTPFHARAFGLPPVTRAEGFGGAAGSAPVLLYDTRGNVVGSEQAQFLTEIRNESDSAFWDCSTPEGMTRAEWSDTVELFPTHR